VNTSKINEILSKNRDKNPFLKKKKIGQKFRLLAHSGNIGDRN
jgi:hypothetical protein